MKKIAPYDVKGARAHLGESQEIFARRLGVSQPTILRWERNGLPDAWQYGAVRERIRVFIEKLNKEITTARPAKKKSRVKKVTQELECA